MNLKNLAEKQSQKLQKSLSWNAVHGLNINKKLMNTKMEKQNLSCFTNENFMKSVVGNYTRYISSITNDVSSLEKNIDSAIFYKEQVYRLNRSIKRTEDDSETSPFFRPTSQFESSILEEILVNLINPYLFGNINCGPLSTPNKKYDFAIYIENHSGINILATVEVKTYLDKTMYNSAETTLHTTKLHHPKCKNFIVMETNALAKDFTRHRELFDGVFVLRQCRRDQYETNHKKHKISKIELKKVCENLISIIKDVRGSK